MDVYTAVIASVGAVAAIVATYVAVLAYRKQSSNEEAEAQDRLRMQASAVYVDPPHETERKPEPDGEAVVYQTAIQNMSGAPIRDAGVTWTLDGQILPDIENLGPDPDGRNWWQTVESGGPWARPRRYVHARDVTDESRLRAVLEFSDARGVRWHVDNADRFEYRDEATGNWTALRRG